MKSLFMSLMVFSLVACQGERGPAGVTGPQGPGPTPPVLTELEQDVANLLADENEYRQSNGQTDLTSGLSCSLYTFTSGDRIQSSIAGHNTLTPLTNVANFLLTDPMNQANNLASSGLSILPEALRPVYTNMYMVRCQGELVITETAWHLFELASDDGSVLYIDGTKVIDNDNNHGIINVVGMKNLRRGVHSFRVDFAQSGGGNQALILKMDSEVLNPLLWAH